MNNNVSQINRWANNIMKDCEYPSIIKHKCKCNIGYKLSNSIAVHGVQIIHDT